MIAVLWVALFGAIGVLIRYWLVTLYSGHFSFPVATLVANVLGSFLIGASYSWSTQAGSGQSLMVVAVSVGLLGGLTTFSSYSLETVRLIQSGYWGLAATNLLANNLCCLLACYIGVRVGQWSTP